MYIDKFWCGVIATVITEVVGFIIYAMYLDRKYKEGK